LAPLLDDLGLEARELALALEERLARRQPLLAVPVLCSVILLLVSGIVGARRAR
jgi:hypothetical protein